MAPFGVALAARIAFLFRQQGNQHFEAVFDAIAAGAFLCVALAEILPGELAKSPRLHRCVVAAFSGLGLMALLALYT